MLEWCRNGALMLRSRSNIFKCYLVDCQWDIKERILCVGVSVHFRKSEKHQNLIPSTDKESSEKDVCVCVSVCRGLKNIQIFFITKQVRKKFPTWRSRIWWPFSWRLIVSSHVSEFYFRDQNKTTSKFNFSQKSFLRGFSIWRTQIFMRLNLWHSFQLNDTPSRVLHVEKSFTQLLCEGKDLDVFLITTNSHTNIFLAWSPYNRRNNKLSGEKLIFVLNMVSSAWPRYKN